MHKVPVAPDTDHMDEVSVKTRELVSRLQSHLVPGVSVALVIDWMSQQRWLEFYRTRSNGQLLRHTTKIGNLLDPEVAFQDVLSEAVLIGHATVAERQQTYKGLTHMREHSAFGPHQRLE